MPFTCNCLGKNGERNLYSFSLLKNGLDWIVFLCDKNGTTITDLDLQFTPFSDDTFRVTNMYIDNPIFRSKGIIESVICKVSIILQKHIVSSAKNAEAQDYRFAGSESFWKRAVANQWAEYDEVEDRYKWKSTLLCDQNDV